MADQQVEEGDTPKKSSKMPILIGVVLALVGGGGGFYAASSGLILNSESQSEATVAKEEESGPKMAFLDVEPLTISLPPSSPNQHLRFRANLEVPSSYSEEVTLILPRVVDVMNSYLRALAVEDLQEPSALMRLRSQLLRRIQVVAGPGRINDLLVMEFVLN